MNAYEIADGLSKSYIENDNHGIFNKRIQVMLRQQADRIAELKKDLHMVQRHYDQLDTQLHQKPLSDEEIEDLVDKCTDTTDDNDGLEFRYNDFAKAIEERHGIK